MMIQIFESHRTISVALVKCWNYFVCFTLWIFIRDYCGCQILRNVKGEKLYENTGKTHIQTHFKHKKVNSLRIYGGINGIVPFKPHWTVVLRFVRNKIIVFTLILKTTPTKTAWTSFRYTNEPKVAVHLILLLITCTELNDIASIQKCSHNSMRFFWECYRTEYFCTLWKYAGIWWAVRSR